MNAKKADQDAGQDLSTCLQSVSTSTTSIARCEQAALALIKDGDYETLLQVFEDQISLIANPNDFKFGMGQRRLAFLFVIDAVCIGNPNSTTDASIAPETRQQLMNVLGPHLPAFVARLATPCNCERIEKLLEGWLNRKHAPKFPEAEIQDAKMHRLRQSRRKRKEKLATRIAATCVQSGQGTGADSYLPLNIPCMYGSFIPKLPSSKRPNDEGDETAKKATATSLAFGVDMLKKQLGDKYMPHCAPPRRIQFLDACVGGFEAGIGEDVQTAEWMWADQEEIAHRKRLKVNPPPVVNDTAGMSAARNFMRNAQGGAADHQRDPLSLSLSPDAIAHASAQRPGQRHVQAHPGVKTEPGAEQKHTSPQKRIPGLGTWETVDPDEPGANGNVSLGALGPHGKFSVLRLDPAASPQAVALRESASPKPVSWLQPSMLPQSQGFCHLAQPSTLLPPRAPQYGGAPAYEAMDIYADIYGGDTYGAHHNFYYAADDFYQPPLPSEPYEEEEAPPLPDEPPPPLPDEPPPPLDGNEVIGYSPQRMHHEAPMSQEALPPPAPQAYPPDSPPPPLPDEPPPPLPDEQYEENAQIDRAAAPPTQPPPPPVVLIRPPPSDTESGELVDSGTPTPRRGGTTGFPAHANAAASAPHPSPPAPPGQHPPQPSAEPPVPANGAASPVATSAPIPCQQHATAALPAERHGMWLANSTAVAACDHSAPHSDGHNPHVNHAHSMLQPQQPEAQWDVPMQSASASPVPGDVTNDPHAQHMMSPHHGASGGYCTPETFVDPSIAQQVSQHHYMMTIPGAYPGQHNAHALPGPPGAHMHTTSGPSNAYYNPGGAVPGWNNDREHSGSHAFPGSYPNSRTASPFPGQPPGAAPHSMPSSISGSPLPRPPGAPSNSQVGIGSSQALPRQTPPGLHNPGHPPVAPPLGAPPHFHHMGGPHPCGDMPAWGNHTHNHHVGMPPNGAYPGQHGFANGMMGPLEQWPKTPGKQNQRGPQQCRGHNGAPQKASPGPPWM